MNLIENNAKTMSSREIAQLTGKRHDNVMRTINSCGDLITPQFEDTPNSQNGQTYKTAKLNKRDSLVLVARLSPEFTAAVIDRWQELEGQQQFKVPTNFIEAMELATEQAKQLEEAKPKLAVYDALADRKGDVSTTVVAKQLGMTAIRLNRFLRDKGVKWQNADLPKAGYMDLFNVVSDIKNGHEFTQCLITPKGQIEIAKMVENEKPV